MNDNNNVNIQQDQQSNSPQQTPDTKNKSYMALWAMIFLFGLPYLAAYYFYFNRDSIDLNTSNYGTIVNPGRPVPDAALVRLDGSTMQMAESRGKWLLVSIGSSQCADACQENLYKLRQVKKAIGQEHKRINKYFFLTDEKALDSFRELLIDYKGMEVILPSGDNYMEFLSIFSVDGHNIEDGIYIIDPLGNYMMKYSKDEEPMKILKDMERLLKVSKIG